MDLIPREGLYFTDTTDDAMKVWMSGFTVRGVPGMYYACTAAPWQGEPRIQLLFPPKFWVVGKLPKNLFLVEQFCPNCEIWNE